MTNGTGKSIPSTPPRPGEGRKILSWAGSLHRWLMQNRIIPGMGLYARRTASGTILSIKPGLQGSGGGGCSNFSITTEAESTGGGNFKIVCSVSAGVFQGVPDGTYDGIPTFDGSGKINADPAPTKDLTENGTWYIHFKMTFNGSEQLTAVDIHFTDPGTALPTDTAGTTHYYLLGTVEVSGDGTSSAAAVITQGTCENKTVKLCGGTVATIGNG